MCPILSYQNIATLTPVYSDIIKPLYQAIVRPIIEYNSPVWNPWLLKDIQELDKVQKR